MTNEFPSEDHSELEDSLHRVQKIASRGFNTALNEVVAAEDEVRESVKSTESQTDIINALESQEPMTDEELGRIEAIVGTTKLSRRQAEIEVLGAERAAILNEEEPPVHHGVKEKQGKPAYPGRNAYKGSTTKGRHPKPISPRIRTAGDANSGDPHLR
jgi:hypothetical protein